MLHLVSLEFILLFYISMIFILIILPLLSILSLDGEQMNGNRDLVII